MRHFIFCGTAIWLVLASRPATAQRVRSPAIPAGGIVGSQEFPTSQFSPPSTPAEAPAVPDAGTPRNGRDHARGRHAHHDRDPHRHRGRSGWWFDVGFPGGWSGAYAPGFPLYYPAYRTSGYTVVVPLTAPVGAVGALPATRPANNPAAPAPAPEPAPIAKPKASHAQQKARAGRFIGFGDASFAKQEYNSAVERYKTAMEIAPDVAESYFRQAFARVAMGQYRRAAATFRRGLGVRSDWSGSPFRLDQMYDGAALAKTSHVERLAAAVEANPFDAELLLVLGMQLYFDGERERAGVFFARAAQLGGNEEGLLDDFLPKPKPAGAADPPKPPGKIVF